MLIAILADIHANLEALSAVKEELASINPDKTIFLGDVVGYGADPEKCIELVREICDVSLMGNHDAALLGLLSPEWFVSHARIAIEWSRDKVGEQCRAWLRERPYTHLVENTMFCHGSAVDPENFDYILSRAEAENNFRMMKKAPAQSLIVGHAHQFNCYDNLKKESISVDGIFRSELAIEENKSYVINLGSVGQPRDGDVRSAIGLYDTDKKIYRVRRVSYDYETASKKIADAGLPEILSQRLLFGR